MLTMMLMITNHIGTAISDDDKFSYNYSDNYSIISSSSSSSIINSSSSIGSKGSHMNTCHFMIALSFFSIPLQILYLLYRSRAFLPRHFMALALFFALFHFLCGMGHLLWSLGMEDTVGYRLACWTTLLVAVTTTLYLLPLTEHIRAFVQSLEVAEKLQEETAAKRKLFTFMTFLCHEIRNPLFAITSTLSFLGDDQLTEEQETALNSIRESTNLMLRLVNDVLDLSKLDSGKLELDERVFDLRQTLQNVAINMDAQCSQKHGQAVRFRFHVARNVPQFVCGDAVRILQITYNLLSNALKFTLRGMIEYSVSVYEDTDKAIRNGLIGHHVRGNLLFNHENQGPAAPALATTGSASPSEFSLGLLQAVEEGSEVNVEAGNIIVLEIKVRDTGEGIAQERIHHIFEPYAQSKLMDYRKHGGTGLGLSILQKLAVMMSGTIHVTSKLGEGSTFVVYLPLRVAHESDMRHTIPSTTYFAPSPLPDTPPTSSVHGGRKKTKMNSTDFTEDLLAVSMTNRTIFSTNEDLLSMTSPKVLEKPIAATGTAVSFSTPTNNSDTSLATASSDSLPKSRISKQPTLRKFQLPPNYDLVLVVDDNAMNRKILVRMLSSFNVATQIACNGQEAVDIIRKSRNVTGDAAAPHFGFVLMDLMMPVMGGCEAIQQIRQDGIRIPIIALTANALDEDRHKALQSGATEFATKPILREELHAKCCHYLLSDPSSGQPPSQPLRVLPPPARSLLHRRHDTEDCSDHGSNRGATTTTMTTNAYSEKGSSSSSSLSTVVRRLPAAAPPHPPQPILIRIFPEMA